MDRLIRTIKAISVKNKDEGEIGFLTAEEENRWYNVRAPVDALDILLRDIIVKGNVVEFELENGFPKNFTLKSKGKIEKKSDWRENIVNLDQLLDSAHAQGLISITTEMISIDYSQKRAIFKATVTGYMREKEIGTFTGYGDSEAIDTKVQGISDAWIRMAETRAIVRALRWYTNNAGVAVEELEEN